MVGPPDQSSDSRRYQIRLDGCDSCPSYSMALCILALCPETCRSMEVGAWNRGRSGLALKTTSCFSCRIAKHENDHFPLTCFCLGRNAKGRTLRIPPVRRSLAQGLALLLVDGRQYLIQK